MSFLFDFLAGMSRLFAITTPPLYRYPYRSNAEGLRGDMLRISKDIDHHMDKDASHDH